MRMRRYDFVLIAAAYEGILCFLIVAPYMIEVLRGTPAALRHPVGPP